MNKALILMIIYSISSLYAVDQRSINSSIKTAKMLEKKDYNLILNHVNKLNLSISVNKFFTKKNLNKILYFMAKDKKNKSQKINLVLLKKIGSPQINNEYSKERIKKFFNDYLR